MAALFLEALFLDAGERARELRQAYD